MRISIAIWALIGVILLSISSFVLRPQTTATAQQVRHGSPQTPVATAHETQPDRAANSISESPDIRALSQLKPAERVRYMHSINNAQTNPSFVPHAAPNAYTLRVAPAGITPTIVPNSGTLVYYPSQDAEAAAGYDEFFNDAPDDMYWYTSVRPDNAYTSGAFGLRGYRNVLGLTSFRSSFTGIAQQRIQYIDGTFLPCTTIGTGDSIFTNYNSNCTKIQNITQLVRIENGVDGGFVLTSSGKVIDFKAARNNLPTNAVKLANSDPCAIALRSDKSIVVLNKSGVDGSEYPYYGDERCYGLSDLFAGNEYLDVNGYALSKYSCPFCINTSTSNLTQFTTVDVNGVVTAYTYDKDSSSWTTAVVYSPTDDNITKKAVKIPDESNAVLTLNDESIVYANTPEVNGVACTIPNDIQNVKQLEIVNSYTNYQDLRYDPFSSNQPESGYIKIGYALRNDNTLWRWHLPTSDTCYDSAEQLATGIKQFAATAIGVAAIKTTYDTNDLAIRIQPIENASLFKNSTTCGIFAYANGGVRATASNTSRWMPVIENGIRYQWYKGTSGDTSQPISNATSPVLCVSRITTAGPYWVQVNDALTTINSRTVNISWIDVDTNNIAGSMIAWGNRSTQINTKVKSWRDVVYAGYWSAQTQNGERKSYLNQWDDNDPTLPWYINVGLGDWGTLWRKVADSKRSLIRLTSDNRVMSFSPGDSEYSTGNSTCTDACSTLRFQTVDASDHWNGTKSYHLMGITTDNQIIDAYLGDSLEINTISYDNSLVPVDTVALKITDGDASIGIGTHDGLVLFDDGNWETQQTGIVKQYRDGIEVTENTTTLGQVKKIVAGGYHYMALQSDGSVAAWMALSDPTYDKGQVTIPITVTCAKDIAAGEYFSVALTCNGKVVQWGTAPASVPALLANASGVTVRAIFARADRAFAIVNPEVIATSTATRTATRTATNTRTITPTRTATATRSNTLQYSNAVQYADCNTHTYSV